MLRIHIRSMNINSYGKNSLAQCCFTWCSVFLEPIKTAKSEMPVLNEYKSNTLPLEQPHSAVTRRLFIRKARDHKVSELAKILG